MIRVMLWFTLGYKQKILYYTLGKCQRMNLSVPSLETFAVKVSKQFCKGIAVVLQYLCSTTALLVAVILYCLCSATAFIFTVTLQSYDNIFAVILC